MKAIGALRDRNKALLGSTMIWRERFLQEISTRKKVRSNNLKYYFLAELCDLLRKNKKLSEKVLTERKKGMVLIRQEYMTTNVKEAEALAAVGNHEGAREVLDRVHSKLKGGEVEELSHEIGRAAWALGYSAHRLAATQTCYAAYKMTHDHHARILPKDHAYLLDAKRGLAITLGQMGDLPGARALQEYILEAYQRILPEDHPDMLRAMGILANTMSKMGNLQDACHSLRSGWRS